MEGFISKRHVAQVRNWLDCDYGEEIHMKENYRLWNLLSMIQNVEEECCGSDLRIYCISSMGFLHIRELELCEKGGFHPHSR